MYFAAYPAQPTDISQVIETCERRGGSFQFQTWRSKAGAGGLIDVGILPVIQKSGGLLADLTIPNNNVFFELGYAIGFKKPIIPIVNSSMANAASYLSKLGLFDNVLQVRYENSNDLHSQLINLQHFSPIFIEEPPINISQPVYLTDAYRRSEFAAKIVSSVKKHIVSFRSFDPQEDYRMSLRSAWESVCQSTGIVVSMLNTSKEDFELHNLRSSFLAGLSIALGRETLILLDSEIKAPLDFVDQVIRITHPDDIGFSIKDFGIRALARSTQERQNPRKLSSSLLSRANAGAAAAENELRRLGDYFVETTAYKTALDGNGRLVVGRKGAGKTAIFWRVRDTLRADSKNTVIDLKPDGYQLRKFKEQLVRSLQAGTKDHTLTAFWEYLILTEILIKIFEDDDRKFYGKNPTFTKALDKLRVVLDGIEHSQEGDFSERMMSLIAQVSARFKKHPEQNEAVFMTSEQITELLHSYDIRKMQNEIFDYLSLKDRTIVLFDNIDKGWGAHGVDDDDILLVNSIIEAFRKIERSAARKNIEFHWLLLLRNDVYELLFDRQSDRGKEDRISVDWDSQYSLKQVIENRIRYSTADEKGKNGINWSGICPVDIEGIPSLDWLVNRCLMKPRYLIKLVSECVGAATTSQSKSIAIEHLHEGYRLFSFDALENTNLDIRDVCSFAENTVYSFIGSPRKMSLTHAKRLILAHGHQEKNIDEIIRLLFWYGFLGISSEENLERYIYDYRYNEKIFTQSRLSKPDTAENIVINLAFSKALDCT